MQSVRSTAAEVIVIHGPSGGVGRTTLALCLAYLYASRGRQTVLMDLSQYGTISPWLRLPRGTSSGLTGLLAADQGQAGPIRLRGLVPAPGAGDRLHLVLSSGPAKMDQVKAPAVEHLVQQLASTAQVIVVDTGSELTDRTLGALMSGTRIAMTLSPHVTAGWQALEFLDILRSAYVPRDRIGVVFNRVQPGGRFGLGEYQQVLGLPVLGVIPESPSLRAAAECGGAPDVRGNNAGMWAIRQLGQKILPIYRPEELRRPWLLRR